MLEAGSRMAQKASMRPATVTDQNRHVLVSMVSSDQSCEAKPRMTAAYQTRRRASIQETAPPTDILVLENGRD